MALLKEKIRSENKAEQVDKVEPKLVLQWDHAGARIGTDSFQQLRIQHYGKGLTREGKHMLLELPQAGVCQAVITDPCSFFAQSEIENFNFVALMSDPLWQIRTPSGAQPNLARFNLLNAESAQKLRMVAKSKGYLTWTERARFAALNAELTWPHYLETRRSSFNRNQRRCLRLMEEQGFSFTNDFSDHQLLQCFEKRAPLKGDGDYTVTPSFQSFFCELRQALKSQGRWYEVGIVKDGELAAFLVGYWGVEKDFYTFQTSYDPQYRSLRLGQLTFEKGLEDIITAGCRHLSFLGDSEYFYQFTNAILPYEIVDVYPRSWRGVTSWLKRVIRVWGGQLKRRWISQVKANK